MDKSYESVMGRRSQILKDSVGIDYEKYEREGISFDYEAMMNDVEYSLEEMMKIQSDLGVGNTPLIELRNITKLVRKISDPGKGARIFLKDEASNSSGSFKARRAAISVYKAKQMGYKGVLAATSGNYGAAVASMAMKLGLKAIIVQECYDSNEVGQPEILEKARACESLGAEVVQMTVGPELFYKALSLLEDTKFFNASLYTPYAIAGVETLGYELVNQVREKTGKEPDVVICTNAGGGNLTGTARGVIKAGASETKIVGASVDLSGLHMASDNDFNRKSFTTGHTGFSIPFTTWPDRSDVLRSAGRPLRYLDRHVTVKQGEVFYATEMLAQLEGMEKGPAGNTSLAAAISIASELDENQIVVVQETEYTGAGKHINPQLSFAKNNGIEVKFGDPQESVNGKNIILPSDIKLLKAQDIEIRRLQKSFIKNAIGDKYDLSDAELKYLDEEINDSVAVVKEIIEELR
ncbi:MAG: 2-amino-4-oxopentanoate thiolase subunit OrtB [Bacilli bacterium]